MPEGSGFPVSNLPFGVFSRRGELPRVGVAIGEHILDLHVLTAQGALPEAYWFASGTLNSFLAAGPRVWHGVRDDLTRLLTDESHRPQVMPALVPAKEVRLHLPFNVGDLLLFQTSESQAANLGRMFLPPGRAPLPRTWRHLPPGQYGRAAAVSVSGSPVTRPSGQQHGGQVGPETRLDLSAELGYVVGVPSAPPYPLGTADFARHVFGVVLMNAWRAWDLMAWESRPLGPFLGQAFAVSVSPWVVPLTALNHARARQPVQEPPPPDYLAVADDVAIDVTLRVELNGTVIAEPGYAEQYWTGPQLLAQASSTGAPLRTGDLLATGPVGDGATLLDLTWNGRDPLGLPDGSERVFLRDGDTVRVTGSVPAADGSRLGLGEVIGTISPAI
ncbi:fumarylacetoacetate hydrolase family protein [Nonomuraea sp. NBC_01738]|uniref:fumarylacetoacetate hydrolase family protein n=1 Tax=Nonomuraea sp. NBC_01738 TaxID=2976003 RepID=UPI002E1592FE|nr:fumarylacetoacetate hydrolase family protein [Nonomuraea sp. NBC_01738]